MGDRIEEIAFLGALLTEIASRIESLKLRNGTQELMKQVEFLKQEVQKLKDQVKT